MKPPPPPRSRPLPAPPKYALPSKTPLPERRRLVPGPLVHQPAPAAKLAAILHLSAMDLWDVATEQDEGRMWEESRAIAIRILAACPSA